MKIFVGIDVSLASSAVCVLDERGQILKQAQIVSEPEAYISFLSDLPWPIEAIGLEAGPLSQWLHRGLKEAGFELILMETRQVKAVLKAMPVKTDRRDAEGIARLLCMGWFRPVHCKSVSAQEMRALLSARKAVQKALLDIEQSLRGVLRNFGLKLGPVSKIRYEARIRELVAGNSALEAASAAILRARAVLRSELSALERRVLALARHDDACRLMMTMPGVGAVVALTVRSAIDDPRRFHSSRDIGPWAGLTPRREQSGERDVSGRITKAGDASLRTALFNAATVLMHRAKPCWLKAWGLQVAKRRGQKRATVAVARRIGVVLHRMWLDGTEFRMKRCSNEAPGTAATA
ncbi:IS110 family transposase (plasmid) [Sulfitobacter faviae]|uniref:IS110 family transposase n=1 Tax=Sulfitobacter faviae TaxID=1775881 RepID=A0ABZ0V4T2_9RHOB|nr:IS110 family transposase [Sulfitobacter faviae]WPZ23521.1 IS110 family transposase [Sulfitobacter faviae]